MKGRRNEIREEIAAKKKQIDGIIHEIIELQKESLLLCDEEQWFREKVEQHPRQKYQRKDYWLHNKLVGRVHWNEDFKDEDTGEVITIERSQVVRVEGEWQTMFFNQ